MTNADEEDVLPYPVVSPNSTVEVDGLSVVHVMIAEVRAVDDATEEITGGVVSAEVVKV